MAITDEEIRMTTKTPASKGLAMRAIARQLSLSEGTVRCHLRRIAAKARAGRGGSASSPRCSAPGGDCSLDGRPGRGSAERGGGSRDAVLDLLRLHAINSAFASVSMHVFVCRAVKPRDRV